MMNEKRIGTILLAGMCAMLCAGCATTAYLDLQSDPSGAEIKIQDGPSVGTTPTMVRLGPIPAKVSPETGWDVGKTYVAYKKGYDPISWRPKLSLEGVSSGPGFPHTWSHIFVLTPASREPVTKVQPPPPPAAPVQAPPQAPGTLGAATRATGIKGTVSVVSEQEGADIYVDGAFVGNSPANLKLTEGMHVVEVKRDGFQSYRKDIQVLGDSELTLRVRLTP